jgi:cytoskeletal protein RodZ|tara:strand:+ start:22843 stop:23577 length:735 start_codon:yes stop_codon:yes gene_type:complete
MPKEIKSVKIGSKFLDERSKLNLTLEDISKNIHINIRYLKAIESDDYSLFPARAFAIGYFKKYSDFLGIKDPFPLNADERIVNSEENKAQSSSKQILEVKLFIKGNLIPISAILILILSIIFILMNNKSSDLEKIYSETLNIEPIGVIKEKSEEKLIAKSLVKDSNLILVFSGPCWVEIYSNNKKRLIYKLYNKDEILGVEIEKSFTLVIGNIDNVKATYGGKIINFINNVNKQKVSTTVFNNE